MVDQANRSGPAAARLTPTYDTAQLSADLRTLEANPWQPQRSVGDEGFIDHVSPGWRCLALRSPSGDGDRTDAGGAGLSEFEDTPWLRKSSYLQAVLASIPAPLRGVRLMRLEPGTAVDEHQDGKCGLAYGTARLHVPIATNPDAILAIGGLNYTWEPGTLWYADFRRPHAVRNEGSTTRTHLVIDTHVTKSLFELFPLSFRRQYPSSEVLFATMPDQAPAPDIGSYACRFSLPAGFLRWSEEDDEGVAPSPYVDAALAQHDGCLALYVNGVPEFGLVHLGNGRFRLAGWTEERTLTVEEEPNGQATVRITTCYGELVDEATVPARLESR